MHFERQGTINLFLKFYSQEVQFEEDRNPILDVKYYILRILS